jgi:hypothetical protein
VHDITAHDAHTLRKADPAREICRARRTMRIEFDAGDNGTVLMGEIARGTGQARAEIRDLAAAADECTFGQRVDYRQPAVMVLVVGEQIFRCESVEMAAPGLYAGENLSREIGWRL